MPFVVKKNKLWKFMNKYYFANELFDHWNYYELYLWYQLGGQSYLQKFQHWPCFRCASISSSDDRFSVTDSQTGIDGPILNRLSTLNRLNKMNRLNILNKLNPILDTSSSCSVLRHARTTLPDFLNGLDWRALVKD